MHFKQGFYDDEHDGIRPFRWMSRSACLALGPHDPDDWLILSVGYPGGAPVVLNLAGSAASTVQLATGWQTFALRLSELAPHDGSITLQCGYQHPAPGDSRELSLMIGDPKLGQPDDYTRNFTAVCQALGRAEIVDAYPVTATFEASSICNLRCTMCITACDLGVFEPDRADGLSSIESVCRELLPYTSKVQWHASGEVFTSNEIWRALKMIGEYPHPHKRLVEIFTNGQLLNAQRRRALLDSPVTNVVFSVDAATAETYKRLRGSDFSRLIRNIGALVAEDKEASLNISLLMVTMRENIHELPQFIRLARQLGVRNVIYTPLFPFGISMPSKQGPDGFLFYYRQQLLMHYPRLAREMIAQAEQAAAECGIYITETPCVEKDYDQFTRADLPYPLPAEQFDRVLEESFGGESLVESLPASRERYRSCPFPWVNAHITSDGLFSPCHYIMYSGGLEPLNGRSFQEVWNGAQMQSIRRAIMDGEIHPKCKEAMCQFVTRVI